MSKVKEDRNHQDLAEVVAGMQEKGDEIELQLRRENFVRDYGIFDYLLSDYENGRVNGTISLFINVFLLVWLVTMFLVSMTVVLTQWQESSSIEPLLIVLPLACASFGYYYYFVNRRKEAWQKAEIALPSDGRNVEYQKLTLRKASKNFSDSVFGSNGFIHRLSNSLVSLGFMLLMTILGVLCLGYPLAFVGFFFGFALFDLVKDIMELLGALWLLSISLNLIVSLPIALIFNWDHKFKGGIFDGQALAHGSDHSDGGGE